VETPSHLAQGSVIYFTFGVPKVMVSSHADLMGQAAMHTALLTAIVTWISANFELPPDYNHPAAKRCRPCRSRFTSQSRHAGAARDIECTDRNGSVLQ